ncbi:hypothetical protein HanPI659440_Chr10g0363221 [Helianthus annuus]|nr:hypothetical protein HanPI659440_Chr10g0363221 [Helianthus annuus]
MDIASGGGVGRSAVKICGGWWFSGGGGGEFDDSDGVGSGGKGLCRGSGGSGGGQVARWQRRWSGGAVAAACVEVMVTDGGLMWCGRWLKCGGG